MHPLTNIPHLSHELQYCIHNCRDCESVCLATVPYCSAMGVEHASASHITTLLICAKICATSADFMAVESPFHSQLCAICFEVCKQCAEECERIGGDDAQMIACAEVCYRCAASCKQMATMAE